MALASSFHIEHPRYELIFCVTEDDDPVIPLVRRLIDDHPKVPARLLIGGELVGVNPKLDNLMKGWDAAAYDWVVLCDSNVLIPPDYLDRLFVRWTERTMFVSSPVVGIEAQGGGAELEAAFLNTYQARMQLVADAMGHAFVMGKTTLLRRGDLAREGGLAVLGTELGEDTAASRLARRRGREVHLARRPFEMSLGRRRFADVWRRQLRWAKVRVHTFPIHYFSELSGGSLPALVLACGLAIAGLLPWAGVLALVVLWYAAEVPLAYALGAPPKWYAPLFWIMRDLLLPIIWVGGWVIGDYEWRGRAIDVRSP
jgi:ceramide glucosyltransferase